MGESTKVRVTPKEFNELYLPVQWINDEKNPGVMDPDEKWVHPELLAMNAFLKNSGQEQIDSQKFVEIGMNHLITPPEKRVSHPLLTKDIASRYRIRFESSINDFPEGPYREAVAELVKATALAQIYFNFQRDPQYARHLKTILDSKDYIRLRHFWQNKGPKCVTVKDEKCTSLPGVKIDPNGTWWPNEFTKEDVDFLKPGEDGEKYPWKSKALQRKVLTPGSRIVECEKTDPDSFEYKGKFYRPMKIASDKNIAVVAELMANHLRKAAIALKDESPELSELLTRRAAHIEKGGMFGSRELDELWVNTNDAILTTAFGSVENYKALGSIYGIKSTMQGVLGYTDTDVQNFISGATSVMDESNEGLWKIWESKGEEYPLRKTRALPPRAVVMKLIMNSGAMNAVGYVAGGFLQPNHNNYKVDVSKDEQQTKFVLYGPICAARIKVQGLQVARLAFDESTIRDLDVVANDELKVIIFAESHELGHSLSSGTNAHEVEVRRLDMKKVKAKNVYDTMTSKGLEEMKADLIGLLDLKLYEEKEIISREQRFGAYRAQFGNMLRNLNIGLEDPHGYGGILTFYMFCKHGLITLDEKTGVYSYHVDKEEELMPGIVKEALDVYYSFDPELVAKFDKDAKDFLANSQMGKYVAKVHAANLPKDNVPFYMMMGDLGEF